MVLKVRHLRDQILYKYETPGKVHVIHMLLSQCQENQLNKATAAGHRPAFRRTRRRLLGHVVHRPVSRRRHRMPVLPGAHIRGVTKAGPRTPQMDIGPPTMATTNETKYHAELFTTTHLRGMAQIQIDNSSHT